MLHDVMFLSTKDTLGQWKISGSCCC